MKRVVVLASIASIVAAALGGCASPPPALPPTIGDGVGSQYGNYAAQADGEMRGESGERCVIFNWDRPLTRDLALRLRSASCESRERPGWMVCRELSRTVIPLAQSNLKDMVAPNGR